MRLEEPVPTARMYETENDISQERRTKLNTLMNQRLAEVGDGVSALKAGDAVYGMNDWFGNGAQAKYCLAPGAAVALKPRTLDHPKAAVVPISALAAWQGLFERCRLKVGERVLIHGGSGGVGGFAVQLARWRCQRH